jgi:guanine nucleotide-binding protein subunit alpha
MGICGSKPDDGIRRNQEIEAQLKLEEKKSKEEIKLLLLGAGESGKSTILKQMRLLSKGSYSEEEKRTFKPIIFSNVVYSMKTLGQAMQQLHISFGNPDNARYMATIMAQSDQVVTDAIDPQVAKALKELWNDSGVKACAKKSGAAFHLNDSAKYYFDKLDVVLSPNFVPDDQDILRSRVKTTGIVENTFEFNNATFRIYDVGGQRSERKKWIHCFEKVNAIIFLAAISEYDQKLVEDDSVNRMQEALTLFESICSSRWFTRTSIILFLNKIDLFAEKIYDVPIEDYFPDYELGPDVESGKEYFKERFESLLGDTEDEERQIFTHFTCATDTNQMKFVMESVLSTIRMKSLKEADLI